MRVKRISVAVTVAVAMVLSLGGCVAESLNEEFRAEAEALSERLGAEVPAELIVGDVVADSTMGYGSASGPADSIWWNADRGFNLVDAPGASQQAAEAVRVILDDEGWQHERGIDNENGSGAVVDEFRLDGWYVELAWVKTTEGRAETLSIGVTSPATTRGTDPPKYVE